MGGKCKALVLSRTSTTTTTTSGTASNQDEESDDQDVSDGSACGNLSLAGNSNCRGYVEWAFAHGTKYKLAELWYVNFKRFGFRSSSYTELATLEDYQRMWFCSGDVRSGKPVRCRSPPCTCSSPPCSACPVCRRHSECGFGLRCRYGRCQENRDEVRKRSFEQLMRDFDSSTPQTRRSRHFPTLRNETNAPPQSTTNVPQPGDSGSSEAFQGEAHGNGSDTVAGRRKQALNDEAFQGKVQGIGRKEQALQKDLQRISASTSTSAPEALDAIVPKNSAIATTSLETTPQPFRPIRDGGAGGNRKGELLAASVERSATMQAKAKAKTAYAFRPRRFRPQAARTPFVKV